MGDSELSSLEDCFSLLELSPSLKENVSKLLYGGPLPKLDIPKEVVTIAENHDFEVQAYNVPCNKEQLRCQRIVRIGLIQNSIVCPTNSPIANQRTALYDRVGTILDAAALMGVNIVCLQEAWSKK